MRRISYVAVPRSQCILHFIMLALRLDDVNYLASGRNAGQSTHPSEMYHVSISILSIHLPLLILNIQDVT
jgi:hypothetical protein